MSTATAAVSQTEEEHSQAGQVPVADRAGMATFPPPPAGRDRLGHVRRDLGRDLAGAAADPVSATPNSTWPTSSSRPAANISLGTDRVGRDIWSRTLYGGRVSLAVGFAAASLSIVIGVIIGALSGYYLGWMDQVLMRFTDVVMTFPRVVIILTAAIYIGQSIGSVIFLIGIFSWPEVARLVRGQVLSLREQQFVLASRSIGAGDFRLITSHVMPLVIAPLLAAVTFAVNAAISAGGGVELSRRRRPLAHAKLGQHARNRAQPGRAAGRPLDVGAAGAHDSDHGAEHQLHRRRATRRRRPQTHPVMSDARIRKDEASIFLEASSYREDSADIA